MKWDQITGDHEKRFCTVCSKHVHNLSAMGESKTKRLLASKPKDRLCVAFFTNRNGSIVYTKPVLTFAGILLSILSILGLTGCSNKSTDNESVHTTPSPTPTATEDPNGLNSMEVGYVVVTEPTQPPTTPTPTRDPFAMELGHMEAIPVEPSQTDKK